MFGLNDSLRFPALASVRRLLGPDSDPGQAIQDRPGAQLLPLNPLFETGAPQYAWPNDIVCVGKGYLIEGGIAYKIFEVV